MRIAQIAPLIERIPPKRYGGTERVIAALTNQLVKKGHQVSLFASGDSKTNAKLISVYPKSVRESKLKNVYGSNVWTMHNIGLAYSMHEQFDIIHDHNGILSLPTANIVPTPVVMTIHGAFTVDDRKIFARLRNPYLATISHAQSRHAPGLNYVGTVYNGLDMQDYPFSESNDGYLLYVGRISLEKGVHFAVVAAQMLGLPLIIAAKLDPEDRPYFQQYIEPNLSEQIRWIGEVDQLQRNQLMSRAKCFLHPVQWPEPFGLTLIEAMACGCPVVAFDKGSIPEIIVQGKTGFVVQDVDEMLDAIGQIDKVKRQDCREYALEHFNAARMADGYEKLYNQILDKHHKNQLQSRWRATTKQGFFGNLD